MATPYTKSKKQPTLRQRKAIDLLAENGGSVSAAMRAVGYSAQTAKTPQKLTESDAFKEAFGDDYLSEESLIKAHGELLNQKRFEYFVFPKLMSDEEIHDKVNAVGIEVVVIRDGDKGRYAFYASIDPIARKGALDMAYKIKGTYAPEKNVNINIETEANDEIKALTEKLNALYKEKK